MEDKQYSLNITNTSILKVILWGVLLVALYFLRDLVLVVLTSIVIASFIGLVVSNFPKRMPRTLSVVIIYVISAGLLFGLFYVFMPVLVHEISGASTIFSKYFPEESLLQNISGETIEGAKGLVESVAQNIPVPEFISRLNTFASGVSGGFFQALFFVFGGVFNLILILVISFYLSIQEKGIENFLRVIIPHTYEDYVVDLWSRAQRRIALWVQGQFLLSLLVGILTYLGLVVLGVKYALLLALLSAVLELIPFGIILAVIPAIYFGFLDGGLTQAIWVGGLYVIVQQFENYLLQPLVIKKIVGVSPLVVILSLLVGLKLAGFWGIILAVPVAVAFLELIDDVEKHKVIKREVHKV